MALSQVEISSESCELLDCLEINKQKSEILSMTIKENLQEILKKKGMTLPQLAKASGVPRSTLHSWNEQKAINIEQLKAVAEVLQVSVHLLMYGQPDPHEQIGQEILSELFSGDIRVTLHKIVKAKTSK